MTVHSNIKERRKKPRKPETLLSIYNKNTEVYDKMCKLLVDNYPEVFNFKHPLKKGIYHEIRTALGNSITARELSTFLRNYCNSNEYLKCLVAGAKRIGIDGKFYDEITPEEESASSTILIKRLVERSSNTVTETGVE